MDPKTTDLRMPKYMSPSSLKLFWDDRTDYFKKYLAPMRPPRSPQTKAMSVGSAFDGYVKHALMVDLYGAQFIPPEYELITILESQVSEHVRDFAFDAGKHVMDSYVKAGAYHDLLKELEKSPVDPMFEFDATGQVSLSGEIREDTVTLFGKPDIWYKTPDGTDVIRDWKVNGYMAKNGHSPKPQYALIRDGWDRRVSAKDIKMLIKEGRESEIPLDNGTRDKGTTSHGTHHKACKLENRHGSDVNVASSFEAIDKGWCDQTTIYCWLQGIPVGAEVIIGIEQLVCKPSKYGHKPMVRVAKHMATVSGTYQEELIRSAQYAWDIIHSGHIFDELSREESDRKILMQALVCDSLATLSAEDAEFHRSFGKPRWF